MRLFDPFWPIAFESKNINLARLIFDLSLDRLSQIWNGFYSFMRIRDPFGSFHFGRLDFGNLARILESLTSTPLAHKKCMFRTVMRSALGGSTRTYTCERFLSFRAVVCHITLRKCRLLVDHYRDTKNLIQNHELLDPRSRLGYKLVQNHKLLDPWSLPGYKKMVQNHKLLDPRSCMGYTKVGSKPPGPRIAPGLQFVSKPRIFGPLIATRVQKKMVQNHELLDP